MAIEFRLKAGSVPAGKQCLSTLSAVLLGVEKYMEVSSSDGISAFIVSEDEPIVEDRDKPWIQLSETGSPLFIKTFDATAGAWVALQAVPIGLIAMHAGSLASIPAGWVSATGAAGSTKNLTSVDALWEGGDGGNAGNYSVTATTYTVSPIEFVGLS